MNLMLIFTLLYFSLAVMFVVINVVWQSHPTQTRKTRIHWRNEDINVTKKHCRNPRWENFCIYLSLFLTETKWPMCSWRERRRLDKITETLLRTIKWKPVKQICPQLLADQTMLVRSRKAVFLFLEISIEIGEQRRCSDSTSLGFATFSPSFPFCPPLHTCDGSFGVDSVTFLC